MALSSNPLYGSSQIRDGGKRAQHDYESSDDFEPGQQTQETWVTGYASLNWGNRSNSNAGRQSLQPSSAHLHNGASSIVYSQLQPHRTATSMPGTDSNDMHGALREGRLQQTVLQLQQVPDRAVAWQGEEEDN